MVTFVHFLSLHFWFLRFREVLQSFLSFLLLFLVVFFYCLFFSFFFIISIVTRFFSFPCVYTSLFMCSRTSFLSLRCVLLLSLSLTLVSFLSFKNPGGRISYCCVLYISITLLFINYIATLVLFFVVHIVLYSALTSHCTTKIGFG